MALPPSTANWHWKNKNITKWGEEWMKRELTTISVSGDRGEVVSVSSVNEVDGDVELGQRKSKLITIFDIRITLSWVGTTSDGTEVKGSLTIPEISHEIICDKLSDFVYEWSLSTSSAGADSVFALAKKSLCAALETKLATFPSAIIDTHGKDLTVSAQPSRTGTPTPSTPADKPAASVARSALSQAIRSETDEKVNTTTVTASAIFQASADDLFALLTDEKKIPSWTRAPAVSAAKPDTEYSLFGGGVKGKYHSLEQGKKIVQSWNLNSPTWPTGHYATLTTSLDQSSDSTKVTWSLDGVPLGMEDEIERNIKGYYIHGFKSIGYVELYHADTSFRTSIIPDKLPPSSPRSSYLPAVLIGTLVLAAAFSIPYLSGSSSK
ncbi:hypothetical protein AGABI2DRAFT_63138 [Agaricus bisporus var. bisporus H97]|uniref:hypothetical protein n=1 Tax=Agaricus bisporus var. bisporus (strain H97 / ATCC MYA-4626 / FGSC 10389) TaxID=936046 RepID=UPI00029F5F15|nr:hypothetical protein AGABI2DRAFT_63138 [Agaricus bisporus var. bisporus H97]EKV49903.1 hypothetical protein AGABI2DRAFT_63138 [Agaricus bisporus var. bisporus H97]